MISSALRSLHAFSRHLRATAGIPPKPPLSKGQDRKQGHKPSQLPPYVDLDTILSKYNLAKDYSEEMLRMRDQHGKRLQASPEQNSEFRQHRQNQDAQNQRIPVRKHLTSQDVSETNGQHAETEARARHLESSLERGKHAGARRP